MFLWKKLKPDSYHIDATKTEEKQIDLLLKALSFPTITKARYSKNYSFFFLSVDTAHTNLETRGDKLL